MLRSRQRGFWNFVVPAVAGLAGSLLSSKSSKDATSAAASAQEEANLRNIESQEKMNQANIDAQREFAQHGVSWRVQDAKAAGLHPLFGAGLSGSTFSPSFQAADVRPVPTRAPQDFSFLRDLGQLLGNFLGGSEGSKRAQVDAARAATGGQQSVSIVEHPGGGRTITYPLRGLESQVSGVPLDAPLSLVQGYGSPRAGDRVDPRSHIVDSYSQPGAFWQQFQMAPGFRVILPKTSEPQEVFEDKPLWFWAMVAKANVREYGPGWLTQARSQFPGLRDVYDAVVGELRGAGLWPFK